MNTGSDRRVECVNALIDECAGLRVQCSDERTSQGVETPRSLGESSRMNTLIVGVMGGIGAGKSEVAAILAARASGRVVVADALGHEALRQPEIRDALVRRFGDSILETGEIERRRLAAIVFAEREALAYLESLTHPWIRRRLDEEVKRAREARVSLLVIDAALLLEAGWAEVCDRLVFVDAPPEVRLERLRSKRGWSAKDTQRREAAQLPLTRKQSVADHSIDNSSSQESLVRQVDDLLDRWGLPHAQPTSAVRHDTGLLSSPRERQDAV